MSADGTKEQEEPGPGLVPVAEAARYFGITERAVRKRITAGKLRGLMIDRAWHVYLAEMEPISEPEQFRSSAGTGNQASSGTVPPAPLAAQQPAAAIMQEWIAPLAARIEVLARENGELSADLRNERKRREIIEHERDALVGERSRREQAERDRDELQRRIKEVGIAHLRERMERREEIPLPKPNVAPGRTPQAEQASTKPQRWPWWMRILGGK